MKKKDILPQHPHAPITNPSTKIEEVVPAEATEAEPKKPVVHESAWE